MMKHFSLRLASAASLVVAVARPAAAQWSTVTEQYYLPASHNWVFRNEHPVADRLFNAFDYGHAILYEVLWSRPSAPVSVLEREQYDFITRTLLVNPPRLPLEEAAIAPAYSRLAPEAKTMFEWAHLLHRQIYDVLADNRLDDAGRDLQVSRLVAYYRTRPELAFSDKPKSMALMEGQSYSLAFRKRYPKFNGLIWGYHWLQVGLYDALLAGRTPDERSALITGAVARFRQMLIDPPRSLPYVMPMTPGIAPLFTQRYPEAAAIFDNLHSMHDVISDILANESVPRARKRAEILLAARRYRDDTTQVIAREDWLGMATAMGVENQGGPVIGVLAAPPIPTVELGGLMKHDAGATAAGHAGHQMPGDSVARLADTLTRAPDDAAARERLVNAFRLLEDQGVQRSEATACVAGALPIPLYRTNIDHYRMLIGAPSPSPIHGARR
jgi:hypothetical protein